MVYLVQDKKVIVTQHVRAIETLSRAQNAAILTAAGLTEGNSTAPARDNAGTPVVGVTIVGGDLQTSAVSPVIPAVCYL